MDAQSQYDKSMSLYLRYLKQRGIKLADAIAATKPTMLARSEQHRVRTGTTGRSGSMRFNPKAKLDTRQVRDLRSEQRSTRYGYGSPDGQ